MKIISKVVVKQIVTEKSKEKLVVTFNKQKTQLEQEHQQLLFEQRKLESKSHLSKQEVADRFKGEYERRKEQMLMIDFKIEQLAKLPIGSKIVEKEVEALVEVGVGADWNKIMKEKTIIIQDGIVIRIEE